ncbi:MAG: hypothetical protein AVDCRST_MAG06-2730, partial [uncultured Nocardioides sp.]
DLSAACPSEPDRHACARAAQPAGRAAGVAGRDGRRRHDAARVPGGGGDRVVPQRRRRARRAPRRHAGRCPGVAGRPRLRTGRRGRPGRRRAAGAHRDLRLGGLAHRDAPGGGGVGLRAGRPRHLRRRARLDSPGRRRLLLPRLRRGGRRHLVAGRWPGRSVADPRPRVGAAAVALPGRS